MTADSNIRGYVEQAHSVVVGDLKVYPVPAVGGCCNVYRPTIFSELGYFAEEPLYGVEDAGLCRATREAGHPIVIVDNVKVEHLPNIMPSSAQLDVAYEAEKRAERKRGRGATSPP